MKELHKPKVRDILVTDDVFHPDMSELKAVHPMNMSAIVVTEETSQALTSPLKALGSDPYR